jgi:hypothetical protein
VQRLEQLRLKANEAYTTRDLVEAVYQLASLESATHNQRGACAALTKLATLLRDPAGHVMDEQQQRLRPWVTEQLKRCN